MSGGAFTIGRNEAEWLFRGALVAAGKEVATPILSAVKVTVKDDRVTVLATDRYRVHQLHVPCKPGSVGGEFLMPRHQVQRLLRSWHGSRSQYPDQSVQVVWIDPRPSAPGGPEGQLTYWQSGTVQFCIMSDQTASAEVITHTAQQERGNFPPVDRLFDDINKDESQPIVDQAHINPDFLNDTRYLRSGEGSLRFVTPRAKDTHTPGPMLVVNTEGTARALIQPHREVAVWKEYGDE